MSVSKYNKLTRHVKSSSKQPIREILLAQQLCIGISFVLYYVITVISTL